MIPMVPVSDCNVIIVIWVHVVDYLTLIGCLDHVFRLGPSTLGGKIYAIFLSPFGGTTGAKCTLGSRYLEVRTSNICLSFILTWLAYLLYELGSCHQEYA